MVEHSSKHPVRAFNSVASDLLLRQITVGTRGVRIGWPFCYGDAISLCGLRS